MAVCIFKRFLALFVQFSISAVSCCLYHETGMQFFFVVTKQPIQHRMYVRPSYLGSIRVWAGIGHGQHAWALMLHSVNYMGGGVICQEYFRIHHSNMGHDVFLDNCSCSQAVQYWAQLLKN